MGFKLGKEYDIDAHGVEWQHLSPFKTKPPLYAWYVVSDKGKEKWEELSYIALERIKSQTK